MVALGTTPEMPILKHGTSIPEMRKVIHGASAAFNTGPKWTLRARRKGTFGMLRWAVKHGRWPVVTVYLPDENDYHSIVVTGIDKDRVQYYDPGYPERRVRWMPRKKFLDWWTCPVTGNTWLGVINGGTLKEHS